jgi:hypothetical protein
MNENNLKGGKLFINTRSKLFLNRRHMKKNTLLLVTTNFGDKQYRLLSLHSILNI